MDMEFGGDDFKTSPNGKRKMYEVDYESLSQPAVEKLMAEEVEYVCNVCGLDVSYYTLFDLITLPL